jgi:hypothetical protein
MSNITTPIRPSNPFFQIPEVFCSVVDALFERTDAAFRKVHVTKLDEQGKLKYYDVVDPNTGKVVKDPVTGKPKKNPEVTYIEDIRTGNLYLNEDARTVAFKCALLLLAIPFYTVGRMAWHLCKTPFAVGAVAFEALAKSGEQFARLKCSEGFKEMGRGLFKALDTAGDELFEVVKAPFFGLGAEFVAFCGIFKPHHFRGWEALIEKKWQNGASYKDDFRNIPARKNENCLQAFVKDVREKRPFYLAYCFQVRGNVNDKRIQVIRRESLR